MDKVVIAGGAESITQSPQLVIKKLPGTYSGVQQWLSPSHPETPDAPTMDMSITVGVEHRAEGRRHPRGAGPLGVPLAPAGRRGDRRGAPEGRDLRDRGAGAGQAGRDPHVRHRRAPAPRHHDGEARGRCRCCTRRSPGFSITAGNSSGLNDAGCALVVVRLRLRRRTTASSRWRSCARGRRSACRPPTPASARRSRSRRRSSAPASTIDDLELVEINEAFASMAVACSRILGLRRTRS